MAKSGVTAMEVFKNTKRDNCGECGLPNCMAFSALVIQEQKDPADCPYLKPEILTLLDSAVVEEEPAPEDRREDLIEELRGFIRDMDFEDAAARLGGEVQDGRLAIRMLGRAFQIDRAGGLHVQCHVNGWVYAPLLAYVVYGKGLDPAGEWAAFRDLKYARDWERFFAYRAEAAFHRLADEHTETIYNVLDIFGKEPREDITSADFARVLLPLPKVPMLFAHWKKEGAFESRVSILFDKTIEANLRPDAAYFLATGLIEMFRKVCVTHDE